MLAPSLAIAEMCPNPFSAIVWDTGCISIISYYITRTVSKRLYGYVSIHKRISRAIAAIRKLLTLLFTTHGGIAL